MLPSPAFLCVEIPSILTGFQNISSPNCHFLRSSQSLVLLHDAAQYVIGTYHSPFLERAPLFFFCSLFFICIIASNLTRRTTLFDICGRLPLPFLWTLPGVISEFVKEYLCFRRRSLLNSRAFLITPSRSSSSGTPRCLSAWSLRRKVLYIACTSPWNISTVRSQHFEVVVRTLIISLATITASEMSKNWPNYTSVLFEQFPYMYYTEWIVNFRPVRQFFCITRVRYHLSYRTQTR